MSASISAHIIPGQFYKCTQVGSLPPFIPVPEEREGERPDAMEWDTTVVVHGGLAWPQVDTDRRHSGWEAVEKRWTKHQQPQQQQAATSPRQQPKADAKQNDGGKSSETPGKDAAAATRFPYPHLAIPTPSLESDFRMRVKLSPHSASVSVSDGFKKWTTFIGGEWSGRLGYGVVVGGGQDSQDLVYGNTLGTQVEALHHLQTADEIPALIECKTKGYRTGPAELMRALQDPERAGSVNERLTQYRIALTMKTTDERYAAKVNFGLWVGSCLWRNSEVIYDAYRIT